MKHFNPKFTTAGLSPVNKLRDFEMIGKVFGHLTVIARAESLRKWETAWLCLCDCEGVFVTVNTTHLRSGHTTSCGCRKGRHTHGGTHTKEYKIWTSMHQRCYNQKFEDYHNYGGRGISVCARWEDFASFIADMGSRPSKDYSLDRIDNDGNYEPTNCRWATRLEQNSNKRDTRCVELDGVSKPIAVWAHEYSTETELVRKRLNLGWDLYTALITPRILKTDKRGPRK